MSKEQNQIKLLLMREARLKKQNEVLINQIVFNENIERACRELVSALKNAGGIICPMCGCNKAYLIAREEYYRCSFCRYSFSVISETVFKNTKLPMQKWFHLLLLCIEDTSTQFNSRAVKSPQKTTYYIKKKLKELYQVQVLNNNLKQQTNGKQ